MADIELFYILLFDVLTGFVYLGLRDFINSQMGTTKIGIDLGGTGELFGILHYITDSIMGTASNHTNFFAILVAISKLCILVNNIVHPLAIFKLFGNLGNLVFKVITQLGNPHEA